MAIKLIAAGRSARAERPFWSRTCRCALAFTLAVATLINACVTLFSMILLAKGIADTGMWLLLHLILLPYNLFLVMAVWRHEKSQDTLRMASLGWPGLTLIA